MKANFALTLSFTGIRLLHRAAGGWRFVGDVALDDPDLDAALASLRRTALELEPAGLRTKLVLPDTQIRYLTIDTTEDDMDAAAQAALEGATPYPVSELVFDLSPDGDRTHVAAAARETLAEAEAFATLHRFAPISIVGIPEGDSFLGEPFFGPTGYARQILRQGQSVEPDGVAVVELGALEWPDGPVVTVTEDTPVARDEPSVSATPFPPEDLSWPEQAADDRWKLQDDLTEVEDDPEDAATPADDNAEDVDADPVAPSTPKVGFASRRKPGSEAAPRLGGVSRRFDPTAAAPVDPAAPVQFAAKPAGSSQLPPADVTNPPAAGMAAFLSRRRSKAPEHDPREAGKGDKPDSPPPPKARAGRVQSPEVVPSMDQAADRAMPEIRPQRVPRPKSERQRMTVFGAREPEPGDAAAVGGKPRFLGLVLTAMLLVFLAGVAAWAAVFIDDGLARFFAPRTPEAPVTAEDTTAEPASLPRATTERATVPERPAEPEVLPDGAADPATSSDDNVRTASLDPELEADEAAAPDTEGLAEPEAPKPFDPLEAAAQYAVTGIWTIPPDIPTAPGLVELDDLYVTSIDPPGESVDTLALLPGTSFSTDQSPLSPADPAPPGTEFNLDDRGLVTPTPEGALSPDGILVHLGPPPVVPPDALQRSDAPPDDVDAAVRQGTSGIRPRLRPGDLVENTERRQLGGHSRSELAGLRPRLRPETLKQAEEEDATPTAQAVASSARPSHRPGNFAQIVARAVERNTRAAAATTTTTTTSNESAEPEEVASVAPMAVVPAIPSRSSVAKEATVRNAINLRRINLLGVYGSPSNRRALVRLSNGRYMKVKVGDRIDGGRVSAIGDSELSYVKGNRSIVLTMPRT